MFRRQVKCRNCGFLARHLPAPDWGLRGKPPEDGLERRLKLKQLGLLEPHECSQRQRANIIDARMTQDFAVFCSRHVWGELALESDDIGEEVDKLLALDRECHLFFPYQAGYSPVEHRVLQSENKNRNVLLIGTLLGAVIGAAAAIIAGLVAG